MSAARFWPGLIAGWCSTSNNHGSEEEPQKDRAKQRFTVGSAFFKNFVGGHADPTTGIVSNDCVVSSTNRMISLFLLHISPPGKLVSLGSTRSLCGEETAENGELFHFFKKKTEKDCHISASRGFRPNSIFGRSRDQVKILFSESEK